MGYKTFSPKVKYRISLSRLQENMLCTAWLLHLTTIGSSLTSAVGIEVIKDNLSLVVRKPVFGVSDQVRHKPRCATTENS